MATAGTAHRAVGNDLDAQAAFVRAIELDDQRLQVASSADEKGMLLWSKAKTLESRGDRRAAVEAAQQALDNARSAQLRGQIGRWLRDLEA
jgi:tetratricopeptide (TPR) repeat protein